MSTVSTDPIADMLTRIRNAINVRKSEVVMPHSNIKQAIAELLVRNNFIENVRVVDGTVGKMIKVTVNNPAQNAKITEIARISTPGRRQYSSADKIPNVKRGRGIIVVSTSQGLMTDSEAREKHLGGELICKVY